MFLLDLIIIVVGMVSEVGVMIVVVVVLVGLMMLFVCFIGEFVMNYLMIKMLVLFFLVVVGVVLIVDGFGYYVLKGYIYFVMVFLVGVEMFNIWMCKKGVKLVDLCELYVCE